MPFKAGNQLGRANKGRKRETPKTIWLLQSLAENGVNLQEMLAKSILKAAHGDRQALDLAHLLQKLLPLVANAPKSDHAVVEIDKLVINRYERKALPESINTVIAEDGHPPIPMEPSALNIPLQNKE